MGRWLSVWHVGGGGGLSLLKQLFTLLSLMLNLTGAKRLFLVFCLDVWFRSHQFARHLRFEALK